MDSKKIACLMIELDSSDCGFGIWGVFGLRSRMTAMAGAVLQRWSPPPRDFDFFMWVKEGCEKVEGETPGSSSTSRMGWSCGGLVWEARKGSFSIWENGVQDKAGKKTKKKLIFFLLTLQISVWMVVGGRVKFDWVEVDMLLIEV